MKKVYLSLLLAIFLVLTLCGCQKDYAGTPAWQMSINGESTNGNYFGCNYTSSTHVLMLTFYSSPTYYYPSINISSPVTDTGNYYMNGFASGQYYLRSDVMYDTYTGNGDGILHISRFDLPNKKVSGTFSFTAPLVKGSAFTKSITITNGVFKDLDIQVY